MNKKIVASVSRDNTNNELGFKYQELVAIEMYLDYVDKDNHYLQYEREGDISILDGSNKKLESIEVKHSIDSNKKLSKSDDDFWKTIANIYKQEKNGIIYDKYILRTTKKKVFEFNDISDAEKIKLLKEKNKKNSYYLEIALSNKTEKYSFFKKEDKEYTLIDKNLLQNICKKFTIEYVEHGYFSLSRKLITRLCNFDKLQKKDARNILYILRGHITEVESINDDRKILISDLSAICEQEFAEKHRKKIQLVNIAPEKYSHEKYKYLNKLVEISVLEEELKKAKKNYSLAMYNKLNIIMKSPYVTGDNVDRYENEILDYIEDIKLESENQAINTKQNYYKTQIKLAEISAINLNNVQLTSFHNKGTSHILVEDDKFDWSYNDH